jgi:hypothetical protein
MSSSIGLQFEPFPRQAAGNALAVAVQIGVYLTIFRTPKLNMVLLMFNPTNSTLHADIVYVLPVKTMFVSIERRRKL